MKFIQTACFLLFISLADGQVPGFLHLSVADGLPGNVVYCGLQDWEGYHWFGTDRGLACFNGEQITTYDVEDGLPDPEVLVLYQDSQHRMWTATFSQHLGYRLEGRFYHRENDSLLTTMLPTSTVFHFHEDHFGSLWVTGDSLLRIDPNGKKQNYSVDPKFRILQMGADYMAFQNRSVFRFDPTLGQAQELYQLNEGGWLLFAVVSNNRILCTYQDATFLFEYQDGKISLLDSLSIGITHVIADQKGRFWGSVPGEGVVCFDNLQSNLSNPRWFLPGSKVNTMYQDRQGNMWFLTAGDGVYMLPNRNVTHWLAGSNMPSSNILSLVYDSISNQVLAGDDMGNVHFFENGYLRKTQMLSGGLKKNFVRQIVPAESGTIWLVTDGGFYSIDQNYHIVRLDSYTPTNSTAKKNLGAPKWMVSSPKGYWLATHQGIFHWFSEDGQIRAYGGKRVTSIALDKENILWEGGTEGLYCQADSFQYNWGEQFPALQGRTVIIQASPKGGIWVTNTKHGLLYLDVSNGKVLNVTIVNEHLKTPITGIKNLRVMEDGSVWVSTNKGAVHVKPNWQTTQLTTFHGLVGEDINDLLQISDTLWAATAKGLSMLVLEEEETQTNIQTVLSTLHFQNERKHEILDFSGQHHLPVIVELPSGVQAITVHFAGLQASPGEIQRYIHVQKELLLPFPYYTFNNIIETLTGALVRKPDTLWAERATLNLGATLPPGRYIYQTTAVPLTSKQTKPVTWQIVALPSFVQTVWPWISILSILGFLAWRLYRLRTQFLQIESDVAKHKLQALRAQINPHFVGNSINAIQKFFYPPDPEKASDYIHLFTVLLRKTLNLSESDFIPFSEELQYNVEYLEMIKLRYAGQFTYHVHGADSIPAQAYFPTMFLQPILENATLHGLSPKGVSVLNLHFEWDNGLVRCTVSDNGIGIKQAQLLGKNRTIKHVSKGIEMLERKARMLNLLHHTQLKLQFRDLSEQSSNPVQSGTEVQVSFRPPAFKIPPA